MRRATERLLSGAPIIPKKFDQAVLSTSLPIPGGGRACRTTGTVTCPASLACRAEGFGFNLGAQVSMMCIIRITNPRFSRKNLLTLQSVSTARYEFPGLVGKGADHLSLCRRKFACRRAVTHAPNDALQNRGDAEEIIGEVD